MGPKIPNCGDFKTLLECDPEEFRTVPITEFKGSLVKPYETS